MNTVISTRPYQPRPSASIAHGKMNTHLDVEDDEEQRVDVVADVRLAEAAGRIGARLVGDVLVFLRPRGTYQARRAEHRADHAECSDDEHADGEILPVELRHSRGSAYGPDGTAREYTRVDFRTGKQSAVGVPPATRVLPRSSEQEGGVAGEVEDPPRHDPESDHEQRGDDERSAGGEIHAKPSAGLGGS